ncbi:PREDICTED: solute carrier family 22 member 8 isoform X3 [Cercocebus atys]|uniref:solute carrier family 22 member 8 isoform X3 n=1 Tax=Cercocebus atys TaxID=9531 RepID=UPI0005F4CD57|nr:PREDICTED: solute carrier family 22 member 8 isoform X3 [Cercocebus atys]
MTFSEILDRVGSMGRFQFLHVAILGLPILNMANHNLLQIFTAATPVHHCRPPPNASAGPWVIPMGPNGKPERCLRFVHPSNASLPNDTQRSMEPCLDGWVYNSTKDSIVTEWNLVCNSNKLKEMAQSIFMAGILIGGLVLGDLSDRFGRRPILTCSYLLLAASGSGAAFSPTFPVYMVFRFLCGCGISGITLSTVILNVEWVPTRMRAIMSTALGYCYTVGQFILPGLAYAIPQWRWLQLTVSIPFFIFFLSSWFATGFAYYSLAMGVEEFGVNLYILQIIFGGVDIPAKFITILSLSYLGRHTTQAAALLLAGGAILALTFVPLDLQTVRTVLAVFGKGCLSSSFSCLFLYTSELYPTVIRQTGMGVSNLWTRVGSMLSPLVKITGEVQPFIPNIIYGITALLGGSAALFLPETLNQPLPETIEDLENWSVTASGPISAPPWGSRSGPRAFPELSVPRSLRAKEPKQEPEVEKASQRIPLQPYGPDLGSS